uniref:NB-ARC domain-containing protein n=1 Tax=Leersia perrieri TaxID=77586 RepID=A0A0D9WUZ7_9ORYZ
MDTLLSAFLGELFSRSFSFLIDRCSSNTPSKKETIQRLERMLLRLAITIEEAEGRRITNYAMLHQVSMMRNDMHKGCYVLDTFKFLKIHEEMSKDDDDEVSYNTLALSKINFSKRARVLTRSRRHGDKVELDQMLDKLETVMANLVEFVMLLNNYPSMCRRPYDTFMFMDKCMFGRQMEMESIINFLLNPESPNSDNIGVLPIIGPAKVGKTTLVEHVCYDERVCNHFSRIIFLTESDFREEKNLLTQRLRDGRLVRHKRKSSPSASNRGRLLVVVELADDINHDEWTRMYSSTRSCISAGSKIIITSRSEKIAKLGTTQPLHIKFLSREAYWYFFKVLAFGSSNPEEHPEAASASMMLFNRYMNQEMNKNFIGAFIELRNIASVIQTSVYEGSCLSLGECARFCSREHAYQPLLTTGSGDSGLKSNFVFIPRINETVHYYCEIYNHCRVVLAHDQEEAPKFNIQDVLFGRVAPHGIFDLVLWKSQLPPYYNYIYSSEIHEYKPIATYGIELQQKKRKI